MIDNLQPMPNQDPSQAPDDDGAALAEDQILALRRKQGNWVSWGQSCQ